MGTRKWTAVRQGEGPLEKPPRAHLGLRHPGSGTGRDKLLLLKPLELGALCAKPEPPRGTRSRAFSGCSGVRAQPHGGFSEAIWEKEAPAPEDSGAGRLWAGAAVGSGLPPGGQDQHRAA